MRCWKTSHMVAENARKKFDRPLENGILFSILPPNPQTSMVNLPNVLTTPQQLKNRKNEPAHCIHASIPPLGTSEVGLEGRTSGIDFPSVLLSPGSSSVEAIFMRFGKACHLLYSELPCWKKSYDLQSSVRRYVLAALLTISMQSKQTSANEPLMGDHPNITLLYFPLFRCQAGDTGLRVSAGSKSIAQACS